MKRRAPMPLWPSGPNPTARRVFHGAAQRGGVTVISRPYESSGSIPTDPAIDPPLNKPDGSHLELPPIPEEEGQVT